MKNLNLILIAILTLGLTFTSCKKDDSPEPTPTQNNTNNTNNKPKPEPTIKELLMNKNWIVTAIVFDEPIDLGNGEFLTDLYDFMDDCEKDDYMLFKAENIGYAGLGDLKCDDVEEDSEFLWYQNPDNENELWFDFGGDTQILKIIEIKENTMILETDADMGSEKVPVKLHMKSV